MTLSPDEKNIETDEISLAEAWGVIWANRAPVIVITLLAGVLAAVVSFLMTPKFESVALLSPVSDEDGSSRFSGASALLSQFGGLSALGGISFSSSNKKSEAIATLTSRALTETYLAEKNLLPVLFEESWDAEHSRWKSSDVKKQPTLWQGEQLFSKIRKVVEDKKTGLVTLTITWKDAQMAATWANDLVQRTNYFLRQKSIDQSNRNISYLNDQLSRTSVVELQRAIYALIESEIKKVMIAQGSDEYAFKVIDAAVVAERKSSPKRMLIVGIGLFGGLALATTYVFVFRREKTRSPVEHAKL